MALTEGELARIQGQQEGEYVPLYEVPSLDDPKRSFFNPDAVVRPGFKYYGDAPDPVYIEFTADDNGNLEWQDQWPNQQFVFNEHKLLGNGVVTATRQSRFRSIVGALAQNPNNRQAFRMVGGESFEQSLTEVEKFLGKTRTIRGQRGTYRELLPPEVPLAIIEAVWREENNPILQALQQLRGRYSDELLPGDLNQVVRDTIFSTQRAMIIRMYRTHTDSFGRGN